MKTVSIGLALLAVLWTPAWAQPAGSFAGRWDLTVTEPNVTYPSWLEVAEKDGALAVRAQPREGNVRPVSARIEGSTLIVTVVPAAPARPAEGDRPAAPARPALTWELTASGPRLTGVQKRGEEVQGRVAGVRAPELKRAAPKEWSEPQPLFNGRDLTGWVTMNNTSNPRATQNHWVVRNGELVNEAQGHNIVSTRKFDDFKLRLEFNLDARANSGIYLRGRYEAQMPPPTRLPEAGRGPAYAIYGFVPATAASPCKPGEWCTYEITLVGRSVTLVVNGVTIVDNQEIAGITGGALDSNEGEPGPIYFQGDHTGGIRYRNITISVPKT
ncbi:MAG: 3-keto-disaccharide hydrolase [Bryobacteraceae bacterium]